jgi:hypothetical protein
MDKSTLGIVGAISSLAALPAIAVGAPIPAGPAVPQAQSFAELLGPIPNAVERLKIADADEAGGQPGFIKAQYYNNHHHHHHYRRRHYHHHHHHHGDYNGDGR